MTMFIVERTGELVECVNKEIALDSKNVVIVISPSQKRIYTWMGNQAAPQSKFACARETARMRMETGYKIVNLEERDTTGEFLEAIEEIISEKGTAPPKYPSYQKADVDPSWEPTTAMLSKNLPDKIDLTDSSQDNLFFKIKL